MSYSVLPCVQACSAVACAAGDGIGGAVAQMGEALERAGHSLAIALGVGLVALALAWVTTALITGCVPADTECAHCPCAATFSTFVFALCCTMTIPAQSVIVC